MVPIFAGFIVRIDACTLALYSKSAIQTASTGKIIYYKRLARDDIGLNQFRIPSLWAPGGREARRTTVVGHVLELAQVRIDATELIPVGVQCVVVWGVSGPIRPSKG